MHQLRNTARGSERRLDLIHIVLGIVIVVMAVLAFLDPEENMLLFPLIFFTAAVIRIISAMYSLRAGGHERRLNSQGVIDMVLGTLLLAISIISAVGIWY